MHLQMNSLIKRLISGTIFLLILGSAYFYSEKFFSILIIGILIEILFCEWPKLFDSKKIETWVLAIIYPILPFALIIFLNNIIYRKLILLLFILVFTLDTGSYLVGKYLGKHKLWPRISPKKTWEGFLGGYLSVVLALSLFFYFQNKQVNLFFLIWFSFIVSFLGLSGDLFESWLKRKVNIKDSGNVLPGHGGFLDRFDGVLFAVVFFYLFRDYLLSIIFN